MFFEEKSKLTLMAIAVHIEFILMGYNAGILHNREDPS